MIGFILKVLKLIAKFILIMNHLGVLDDMLGTISDTIDSLESTTAAETTTIEETTLA